MEETDPTRRLTVQPATPWKDLDPELLALVLEALAVSRRGTIPGDESLPTDKARRLNFHAAVAASRETLSRAAKEFHDANERATALAREAR